MESNDGYKQIMPNVIKGQKRMYGNFLTTEIFINDSGDETKISWDFYGRYPTELEKQKSMDYIMGENKRLRLNDKKGNI